MRHIFAKEGLEQRVDLEFVISGFKLVENHAHIAKKKVSISDS